MQGTVAAAGWYADPQGLGQRYWDGQIWTQHTAPAAPPQPVVVQQAGNGLAVAALILGIVGFVIGMIPIAFIVAWGLGIPGFVLGLVARGKAKRNPAVGRKTMATWAVALGIASFGIGCAGYAIVNNAFSSASKEIDKASQQLDKTNACLDKANTPSEIDACSK